MKNNKKYKIKVFLKQKKSILGIENTIDLSISRIHDLIIEIKNEAPDLDIDYLQPDKNIFNLVNKVVDKLKKQKNKNNFKAEDFLLNDIYKELKEKIPFWDIRLVILFSKEKEYKSLMRNEIIKNNFMFEDVGKSKVYKGLKAFLEWKKNNFKNQSIISRGKMFTDEIKNLEKQRKNGVIDTPMILKKFNKDTKEAKYLTKLVCIHRCIVADAKSKYFILLEKSKSNLKTSDSYGKELISFTIENLIKYIKYLNPDEIFFVEYTAKREYQIIDAYMDALDSEFKIKKIYKKENEEHVQQKQIKEKEKRKENADNSFKNPRKNKEKINNKVLLIDDLASSGATLNQLAKKLIRKDIAKQVYGIAILGVEKDMIKAVNIA